MQKKITDAFYIVDYSNAFAAAAFSLIWGKKASLRHAPHA